MPSSASILLVEDDQMDVMNVQRELRKQHIEVPLTHARNGREALNMLRGENGEAKIDRPSLMMLDLNMPRLNGLELLKILRSDPEFEDLNVSGYIIKPLTFDSFGGEGGGTVDSFSLFLDLLKLKG
jgi:CheY-like chemotaxis protein